MSAGQALPSLGTDTLKAYKARPLEDRLALALSSELSAADRWAILEAEQWMQVRCYFARRLDLTAVEISRLLADADHVIRLCIAKRGDLSPEQVAQCVSDRDPNIRYFIARSPQLTDSDRERLKQDPDPLVRRAAHKGPREMRVSRRAGQAALVR